MVRFSTALILTIFPCLALASTPAEDLKKNPIALDNGEVGKLLKKWWADGSAAGNVGDWYDNRDRGHSDLDTRQFPQLQRVSYTPLESKRYIDWALTTSTRPHVTFGNSSTSAPAEAGGSNPRSAYFRPGGLAGLYHQYTHNNVYMYPEHRDHDPGHDGFGDGYGDLYPTNTPYLITSQGSSGSDQPFMRAVPHTLAAFRPEVKKKLADAGLLMPTLQMIFRSSNRQLAGPADYLTGKAHPSVFEGSRVDELKMVQMAHDITTDRLPPMIRLRVVEENLAAPDQEFFEPAGVTEILSEDTPGVIARVWRGRGERRRLVVSAEKSFDLNKKPLSFTWVLLRGEPARVQIRPLNKEGSSAEIVVHYHERRPIAPGSAMESNRVDVGVFAHNGAYHSAPGFITFYSLDSESRAYDGGRLVEIAFDTGAVYRSVPRYAPLAEKLGSGTGGVLFKLSDEQRAGLLGLAKELAPLEEEARSQRESRPKLDQARQKAAQVVTAAEQAIQKAKKDGKDAGQAEAELATARQAHEKANQEVQALDKRVADLDGRIKRLLEEKAKGLPEPPRVFLDHLFEKVTADPEMWNANLETLGRLNRDAAPERRREVDAARARLLERGIIEKSDSLKLSLRPARPSPGKDGSPAGRLTAYERAQLEWFHTAVLTQLILPDLLKAEYRVHFVDRRLTAPKNWRDVSRYEGDRLLGWTRYEPGKVSEFAPQGLVVLKKDERGRTVKARSAEYYQAPLKAPAYANTNPLRWRLGHEVVRFEYDGEKVTEKRETLYFERAPEE